MRATLTANERVVTHYGPSVTGCSPTSWESTVIDSYSIDVEVITDKDTSKNCCPKANGV